MFPLGQWSATECAVNLLAISRAVSLRIVTAGEGGDIRYVGALAAESLHQYVVLEGESGFTVVLLPGLRPPPPAPPSRTTVLLGLLLSSAVASLGTSVRWPFDSWRWGRRKRACDSLASCV
jgi:hypothetical protein